MNKYTKIFITSIQDPGKIYKNWTDEDRLQWMRRMTIVKLCREEQSQEESDDEI